MPTYLPELPSPRVRVPWTRVIVLVIILAFVIVMTAPRLRPAWQPPQIAAAAPPPRRASR